VAERVVGQVQGRRLLPSPTAVDGPCCHLAGQRERLGSRITVYMNGFDFKVLGDGADTMGPASKEFLGRAILVWPLAFTDGSLTRSLSNTPILQRKRPPQARTIILHARLSLQGIPLSLRTATRAESALSGEPRRSGVLGGTDTLRRSRPPDDPPAMSPVRLAGHSRWCRRIGRSPTARREFALPPPTP
jgi:hypothetical protein